MKYFLSVFLVLILPSTNAFSYDTAAVISGIARVKDGDGVLFGKVEVRLQGIAAPEFNSRNEDTGGLESSENLRALVEGKFLICHLDGSTASKRPVGICYLGDIDIGQHQVKSGHARDCPRFSNGRYAGSEGMAARNGRNLSKTYPLPDYCLK